MRMNFMEHTTALNSAFQNKKETMPSQGGKVGKSGSGRTGVNSYASMEKLVGKKMAKLLLRYFTYLENPIKVAVCQF